jgi:hypothetical protein
LVIGEVYETNKQHGEKVNTAGDILFSKFGFEGKDKLSVVNAMLPINQNLSRAL